MPARIFRRQFGRHHRREGQCDERREQHRRRQRQSELAEQTTDVSRQEGNWHEHRCQRHGRRDHGKADLAAAVHRRQYRRLTALGATVNVLEDHDRIIDDQADCEHQSEQREDIDRVAQCIHCNGGRGDRNGDRHRRDQGIAQRAQEQVDDEQHRRKRKADGDQHLAQGSLDGAAVVDVDRELGTGRQLRVDALHLGTHGTHDVEHIGLGLCLYADADTSAAVGTQQGAVVLGADAHRRNFPQPDQMAAGAPADHQIAKVLLGIETHFRAE